MHRMSHGDGMCEKGLGEFRIKLTKKKKVLMDGLKGCGGRHDMLHVWVVVVFCHQTHTNVTLSSVSWCFYFKPTRPIKDQTNK